MRGCLTELSDNTNQEPKQSIDEQSVFKFHPDAGVLMPDSSLQFTIESSPREVSTTTMAATYSLQG